jgi:hypothetical protein
MTIYIATEKLVTEDNGVHYESDLYLMKAFYKEEDAIKYQKERMDNNDIELEVIYEIKPLELT